MTKQAVFGIYVPRNIVQQPVAKEFLVMLKENVS